MQHGQRPWPAWHDYRRLFRHGVITAGGMLYYYAPGFAFAYLAWHFGSALLALVAGALLLAAATIAIPGYMSHYCWEFDPSEIYDPLRALRRCIQGGDAYWQAWLITLSALAISFAGLLALGVGFLVTSVWFWQVAGFSFASVFTQRFGLTAAKPANQPLESTRGEADRSLRASAVTSLTASLMPLLIEEFMNLRLKKWHYLLGVSVCFIASGVRSQSGAHFSSQDFKTKSVFELVVNDSSVLKAGASKIVTQSAFVTLVHGLIPGNSEGFEIQFFTKPITEAAMTDILKHGAKESKKSEYAALVLFLDKDNKIWQANLSYVIPGTTVARTVAWKPEELKKYFSSYKFDGKRLTLKSNGSYSEAESGKEKIRLSWSVDFNLPVFRSVK
jgi:hypothetical protein